MATQVMINPTQLTEQKLIRAGQRGDSQAIETLFLLREVEGYSTGEAAKKLGVTENTLKARLWRARHQLAERLGRRLRRMKDGMSGANVGDEACSYC